MTGFFILPACISSCVLCDSRIFCRSGSVGFFIGMILDRNVNFSHPFRWVFRLSFTWLNKSQYVKLLGLGLIDFSEKLQVSVILLWYENSLLSQLFYLQMLPAFQTISLPGLMNISFYEHIEIFANLLPYHRYDKLQMVFHLREYHFSCKSYDRNNDFSIFIDFTSSCKCLG
jgi:hypothetical protein